MARRIGYLVGEALVGEGKEVAHVDLVVGDKDGPVGVAFAQALASQSRGHTALLAVLTPNLLVKPATLISPKVTVKNMRQAELVFGPAQYAVAKAVADSVAEGVIPRDVVEDIVVVCSLFVHPEARDPDRVYQYNYEAVKLAVQRAFRVEPRAEDVIAVKDKVEHPFYKRKG